MKHPPKSGVAAADADARPAEIRHIHVESTPRDRQFAIAFIATLAATFATLLFLTWLVDPLASHGTGLVPPLVPNDRDLKAAAYQQLSSRPKALIIGSSRVMKLPPSCLEQTLGLTAFSFGLNSARVEDYSAVLQFAQALGPVRRILLGVDPEALDGSVGPDDRLLQSRMLAPFVDASLRPPVWVRLYRGGLDALAWETLAGSLRALRFALFGGRPTPAYAFDSIGFMHDAERERLAKAGRFDQAPFVRASVGEYERRYATFEGLSELRIARLEAFLVRARAAGALADAFIPPLHPDLVRGMSPPAATQSPTPVATPNSPTWSDRISA